MLTTPIPGEAIRADLVREIVEAVRANTVQAGPGILVDRGPSGTVVSAQLEASEQQHHLMPDEVIMAKVTGGSAVAGYTVELYGNGMAQGKTGTGLLFLPECAVDSVGDLPVGSVVLAHSMAVGETGGGEETL